MHKNKFLSIIEKYATPMQPLATELRSSGSLGRTVRAVFFDIYGTLFISGSGDISTARRDYGAAALAPLLSAYGIRRDPGSVLSSYFSVIEEMHEVDRLKGIDFPEVNIDEVWMRVLDLDPDRVKRFALEYEWTVNPAWPMPGLRGLFTDLAAGDLPLGVISNAQFYTPLLFYYFLGKPGDIGICRDLSFYSFEQARAKPSSLFFERARRACAVRGIDAGNVLYVGNDMLNDIAPAAAAGFQTALFAGDARSLRLRKEDERCGGVRPDITVLKLPEITEHINSVK